MSRLDEAMGGGISFGTTPPEKILVGYINGVHVIVTGLRPDAPSEEAWDATRGLLEAGAGLEESEALLVDVKSARISHARVEFMEAP